MKSRLETRLGAFMIGCMLCAAPFSAALADVTAAPPSVSDERASLQQQLQDIEAKISQYQNELVKTAAQKKTLANAIAQLQLQRAALALKVQQTSLYIKTVASEQNDTQQKINQNQDRLAALRAELAALTRELAQEKSVSWIEVLVTSNSLSDFFQKAYAVEKLGVDLTSVADQLKATAADLAAAQNALADERQQQLQLAFILGLQKQKVADNISTHNTLLIQTKGKEIVYQQSLSDSKKKAAEIRTRIYALLQVGRQITFDEALQMAQWASGWTGVRPAFLLAILTQESNLGKNVGTCNRASDPPSKHWRVIMKPDRDQPTYLVLTSRLGRNPDTTPLSCPMRDASGNQVGWGGAMGPAQFIPSTWVGYEPKVTAITGQPADPWDIRDAFLASAIKLKADGGASQGGEWSAAMRYFSGSTNPRFRFYGDNVVATAAQYQNDINSLK